MRRDRRKDTSRSLLKLAALIMATAFAPSHAAEEEPARVLLLHPLDVTMPTPALQNRITREAIEAAAPRPVEFFTESFDAYRLPGLAQEYEFVEFLNHKFASRAPHLIVAHGTMYNLLRRHAARLFPGAPRMFVDVGAHRVAEGAIPPGTPYTSTQMDVAGTVELALRLHPEARRVLVVAGDSAYDRGVLARAEQELQAIATRTPVELVVGRSEAEITSRLSQASDAIVLQLSVITDAAGATYVSRDLIIRLARASAAPMYSYYDVTMGHGVVGGNLMNRASQAHDIGEIARRLLAGEAPHTIPIPAAAAPLCTLDWRQIQRWGIDETRIPATCTILFQPPSLWARYGLPASIGALVLATVAALAAAVRIQRRRRLMAEREASLRTSELTHAARLGSVGSLVASITHELSQPLASIHTNAAAGELLISSGRIDMDEIRSILADIRSDEARAKALIIHLRELLKKREVSMQPVEINDVVGKALKMIAGAARAQHVDVITALDERPTHLLADPVHLQQVILNLAMNAIEAMAASPQGARKLTVQTLHIEAGGVEVAVSDTGCGVPPDHLDQLFEPFYTTKPDGMGIGLSIAQTIINAHGGRIWAESNDTGVTMRFALPPGARASRVSLLREPGAAGAG